MVNILDLEWATFKILVKVQLLTELQLWKLNCSVFVVLRPHRPLDGGVGQESLVHFSFMGSDIHTHVVRKYRNPNEISVSTGLVVVLIFPVPVQLTQRLCLDNFDLDDWESLHKYRNFSSFCFLLCPCLSFRPSAAIAQPLFWLSMSVSCSHWKEKEIIYWACVAEKRSCSASSPCWLSLDTLLSLLWVLLLVRGHRGK